VAECGSEKFTYNNSSHTANLIADTKLYRHVSFGVHTTRMVTGALPLQGRGSGTLCRLNCNNVVLSDSLNVVWRLFYSGRGTTALCDSL